MQTECYACVQASLWTNLLMTRIRLPFLVTWEPIAIPNFSVSKNIDCFEAT